MTRDNKVQAIEQLKEKFDDASFFYITDSSALSVEQVNKLRKLCFDQNVEMKVVKNTLVKKALESFPEERGYADLYNVLAGPTSLMFSDVANVPAKLIKEFRKDHEKPILKAAYIDSSVYLGDENLGSLADLKSKEDLLGEIVLLLQSPAKNVISALNSGGATIAGLVKALEERAQ